MKEVKEMKKMKKCKPHSPLRQAGNALVVAGDDRESCAAGPALTVSAAVSYRHAEHHRPW